MSILITTAAAIGIGNAVTVNAVAIAIKVVEPVLPVGTGFSILHWDGFECRTIADDRTAALGLADAAEDETRLISECSGVNGDTAAFPLC